jgi:hypothetical protein
MSVVTADWTEHVAGAMTHGVQMCTRCSVVLLTVPGLARRYGMPKGPVWRSADGKTVTVFRGHVKGVVAPCR